MTIPTNGNQSTGRFQADFGFSKYFMGRRMTGFPIMEILERLTSTPNTTLITFNNELGLKNNLPKKEYRTDPITGTLKVLEKNPQTSELDEIQKDMKMGINPIYGTIV